MNPSTLPSEWRNRAALFREHADECVARAYERAAEELEAGMEDSTEPMLESKPTVFDEIQRTWTWREKLWVAPAETRIGTIELVEALGRPKSWIYARTQAGAEDPLPHRKLDGTLTFTVGEIRAWIRDREEVFVGSQMHSTEVEKQELRIL